MKTSLVLLSLVAGACASAYNELQDIPHVEAQLYEADKLAPACLIQIDEPPLCGFASCHWTESFERCFDDKGPIDDIILQRRSFDKDTCIAFDEALRPALKPLSKCKNGAALSSDPKLDSYCQSYLRILTSSCAGYTGYVLGVRDAQLSAKYRKEMTSEAPRSEVLERIKSRLVRYRPIN